jgi:tetratricopeptide (TPR) repeat protein
VKNICFALLISISLPLFAGTKTFIREYTYTAGEVDSKITSRTIALEQVKRILLEEIGIYLHSEMTTTKEEKNEVYNELTKQQIQSITAGITETKIVVEKWNGETYYIKASISVDPDEVNKNIARIGADQNKLKELVEVQRKADDAFAEIERLRKELAVTKSENEKLAKQKEYNIALSSSKNDRISKEKEYNKVVNFLTASNWFQRGYNAQRLKDLDNAIQYYEKAIEFNPNMAEAYYNLGLVYGDKGNIDKAIQFYKKVVELKPQDSDAYTNLGVTYGKNGNLDKAIQFCQKAVELSPQDFEAYTNLGTAYQNKGDFEKAVQSYEKAIKLNPKFSGTYYNLGLVFSRKGNLDKAIQSYDKATKLNPKDLDAFFMLGTAYAQKGKMDDALLNIRKAAQLGHKAAQQSLKQSGYTW